MNRQRPRSTAHNQTVTLQRDAADMLVCDRVQGVARNVPAQTAATALIQIKSKDSQ